MCYLLQQLCPEIQQKKQHIVGVEKNLDTNKDAIKHYISL